MIYALSVSKQEGDGNIHMISQIPMISMTWYPIPSCTVILLISLISMIMSCSLLWDTVVHKSTTWTLIQCRHLHICDGVVHRYVQQLFSIAMNLITACWWNNMLLTAILSHWTAGACSEHAFVLEKDKYYFLHHFLCCTEFGTDVCNLTEFMIPNMAHNIWLVA
jgi:hypothetical protein